MILTIIYPYSGFFQPVGNTPALNILKAGASVPVKFSLKGYWGLDILKAGFPTSSRMACPAGDLDAIEQLVTANTSSLNYDATTDQYIYVWKTTKTWSGTCRRFTLTLIDGTVHEADFLFR